MVRLFELVLSVIAAISVLVGVVALIGAFSRWSFVRLSQKQRHLKKVVHLFIAMTFFGLPLMMYHPVLPRPVAWGFALISFTIIAWGCIHEARAARTEV